MRAQLLLIAAVVGLGSGCGAIAKPVRTGNASVDAFLADLEKGNRDSALASLGTMESASGLANAVGTPRELVDKLSTCKLTSAKLWRPPPTPKVYETDWVCPDGDYYLLLDPDWRAPKLTVGQFETRAALQRRLADQRAPALPAPPALSPGHP